MFIQTGGIRCGICKEPGHNRRTCPKADTKPKQKPKPKPKTKRKVRVKKKVKAVVKKPVVAEKVETIAKKPCASNPCPNRDNIIDNFKTMILVADMKGGKTAIFKKRVYNRIIEVVSSCEVEIDDIEMATELFKQAGFKNPKKSLDKVREILDTGELGEVKRARAKPEWAATMAIRELTKVYAIGPKNAATLYEKHDIKTIPELKSAVEKKPSILNDKQLLGVKYHDDLQQRIPRVEIDKFNKICEKILERMNEGINTPHFEFSINGSYRRGNKTSGDIDLLLKTLPGMRKGDGLKLIVDALKKDGYIVETLALGKKKFMGVVNHYDKENGIHRHLDIIETTPAEWPFARLYFTGSGGFNVKMRKHAMDLGYTMNEYSIKRIEGKSARALTTAEITEVIGKPQFETERDIFDFLKYEYKKPEDRRGFTISKMKH